MNKTERLLLAIARVITACWVACMVTLAGNALAVLPDDPGFVIHPFRCICAFVFIVAGCVLFAFVIPIHIWKEIDKED